MTAFIEIQPTLENYWRSVILFGRNVASYKFALGKSLLELSQMGKETVTLEELADPFSRHICGHLQMADKQATSSSSRFLDACRKFNAGDIKQEELLDLWSAWTMATRGEGTPLPTATSSKLVIAGPYRWVRNPMALAGILQGIAVGWWFGSPGVIAYAFTGIPVWHYLVRPSEEADLLMRFGQDYESYRKSARLWIPRTAKRHIENLHN